MLKDWLFIPINSHLIIIIIRERGLYYISVVKHRRHNVVSRIPVDRIDNDG